MIFVSVGLKRVKNISEVPLWTVDRYGPGKAVYAMTPDKLDEFIESGYTIMEVVWPWDNQFYKPSKGNIYTSENPPQENIDSRIHELAKAGALIAAEIDRLLRLKNK